MDITKYQLTPERKRQLLSSGTETAQQAPQGDGLLKGIYKAVAGPVVNMIARPGQAFQHAVLGDKEPIRGKILGVDVTDPYADVAEGKGSVSTLAKDVGRGLQTASLGMPVGTALKAAATGATAGLGATLEEKGTSASLGDIAKGTALGAGFGAGAKVGSSALGSALVKTSTELQNLGAKHLPGLFQRVSGIAPQATELAIKSPETLTKLQKSAKGKTDFNMLTDGQKAQDEIRLGAQKAFDEGKKLVDKTLPDLSIGFGDEESKAIRQIFKETGANKLLPKDINALKPSDLLDLNANLNRIRGVVESSNEIKKVGLMESVIQAQKSVKSALEKLDTLTPDGSKPFSDILSRYGKTANLVENLDKVLRASKGNDIAARKTAIRNFENIFREDYKEYFDVLQALDNKSGGQLSDFLVAKSTKPLLPPQMGQFSQNDIYRLMLSPLTSPKLLTIEAKTLGRILNTSKSLGEYIKNIMPLIDKARGINPATLGTSATAGAFALPASLNTNDSIKTTTPKMAKPIAEQQTKEEAPTWDTQKITDKTVPLPQRYNNPGSLKFMGQPGAKNSSEFGMEDGFAVFNTPTEGIQALDRDITAKVNRNPKLTVWELINVRSPKTDKNNPEKIFNVIKQYHPNITKKTTVSSMNRNKLINGIAQSEGFFTK